MHVSKVTLKRVSVSETGQITIPRKIQTLLGMEKGDRLALTVMDGKIVIQKVENLKGNVGSDSKDLLKLSEGTAKEMWDNKHDQIWNDV